MKIQQQDACREAIYSNDYYDLIIDYIGGYSRGEPACYQKVDDQLDIAYYNRRGIPELSLQDYPYGAIPKCFGLTDLSALESTGILRLQNPAGLDLLGQGVLVGFVDTGIDYAHPAFLNLDGSTRIVGIWDQTVEDGIPPEGYSYGAFYSEDRINEALRLENPRSLVPVRDELGHGTFLAGVACGSADPAQEFSGAVPQSAIAMVKCKQAKQYLRDYYFIPEEVPCYQENDVMLGISWLMNLANNLQMPMILCIGMGSSMGSHGGDESLSELVSGYGRQRQRAIVVSAGNEANARHHYMGSDLEEGRWDSIEISVGENVPGFYMEFWATVPELYRAAVISPSGERFSLGGGVSSGRHTFLFEKTELILNDTIAGNRIGSQLIYFQFAAPYPGIWTIEITPVFSFGGTYHCWLPLTELLEGEVYFLRSNPDTTILSPGMSAIPVTTGAYEIVSGGNLPESGRGYSTTGTIKPELLAPGVSIFGPEPGGRYGTRTGTSAAAALTAGACAQLFQWGVVENNMKYLNSTDLSNLLIRGASRSEDRRYPNTVYGFGLLDVFNTLNLLRSGV